MAADLVSRLAGWLYAGQAYASLLLDSPRQLVRLPPGADVGNPAKGRQILAGTLRCGPHAFAAPQPDWFDPAADRSSLALLHGFGYLADLAAAGEEARSCARALVASWIAAGSQRYDASWAPEILGARVAAWLAHARFLSLETDDAFGREVVRSLTRQAVRLGRTVSNGSPGTARLAALKGLVYAALAGVGPRPTLGRALAALRRELAHQVLKDGSHIERSPAAQRRALAILLDIRDVLEAAGLAPPGELTIAITGVAPVLRLFRHGDGGLALFNGSIAGSAKDNDRLIARSRSKEPAPVQVPHGGYQRLAAGTVLVLQDVGSPAPPGFDMRAHAGCLAFELSDGPHRIIVNCGASDGPMHAVLRTTAAHSTVVVADTNSAELRPDGRMGRRPTHVDCSRDEMDGSIWIDAAHDGYRERYGLVHRRRLYLSSAGDNLRGEDTLSPTDAPPPGQHAFAVRFHIHPDIQASLLQNGAAVLMRLPSGAGWRFQSDVVPHLEEGIYFGDGDGRRSQQIVIAGSTESTGALVKWALQKVPGSGGAGRLITPNGSARPEK